MSDGKAIYGQPVAMGSSFNRDFELVYVGLDGTLNHWYYSQARPGWFSTGTVGLVDWLAGFPGFVEMDDSSFSVVVKTSEASLHEVSYPLFFCRQSYIKYCTSYTQAKAK